MIYKLGPFDFLSLNSVGGGPPELPRERVQVVERPGINGTGLLFYGFKGTPFNVQTLAGINSRSLGIELIELYNSRINGDALSLIWADEAVTVNHGVAYQIIDVLYPDVFRIGASSAGYPYLVSSIMVLLPVSL